MSSVIQPSLLAGGAKAEAASQWQQAASNAQGPNEYSPDKFFVRATDQRGHSKRVSINLSPERYAELMKLVHSDDFPDYQSPADVIRDAIVHLFAMRKDQLSDPRFKESLEDGIRDAVFSREVEAMAYAAKEWQRRSEVIRAAMVDLEKVGAWEKMDQYLHRVSLWAEGVAEPYASLARDLVSQWREKMPDIYKGQ